MRPASRILSLVLVLVAACGDKGPVRVRVTLSSGAVRATVEAEIAATPAERARGLMFREAIPAGTGMLFVFPALNQGAFFMKNTTVPLTIFFIRDGRVVERRDMQPCPADPCPLTTPSESYLWALEVAQGSLPGIDANALVEISGRLPKAS